MAGLPLWLGSVPDYEVVSGHMHVTVGEFCIAMPINVFLCGCVRGRQAIVTWEQKRQDAEVIRFPSADTA
jgi:hypothetical protein